MIISNEQIANLNIKEEIISITLYLLKNHFNEGKVKRKVFSSIERNLK
jgi:hypothetical protein